MARPVGVAATFGGIIVGTVGFAAPELATNDPKAIGPWSDVFSLATVIYYVLTGEEYFSVSTPAEAIIAAVSHGLARGDPSACYGHFGLALSLSGWVDGARPAPTYAWPSP